MLSASIASALHLTGLVAAGMCLVMRGWFLRDDDLMNLKRALLVDWISLVAGLALMGGGFWRLFGELEKPLQHYTHNWLFWLKMFLVLLMWVAEIPMMLEFIRWRYALREGSAPKPSAKLLRRYRQHHVIEIALATCALFCAAGMAHGLGAVERKARAGTAGLLCSVERVVAARCVTCHKGTASQASLELSDDFHRAVVDRRSEQFKRSMLVVSGSLDRSLLWLKLTGKQGRLGSPMPLGSQLSPDELLTFRRWIEAGAPNDCQ
jgi:uncharacterized membrane protein